MHTVGSMADFLERLAPLALAESWDNVGLLIGDRRREVHRVMTCLTVTPIAAGEAIERQAELLITHHPVLFRPVQRLTDENVEGRTLLELIQAGVSVYSPHTAFDGAARGINEILAERLGLTACAPLRHGAGEPRSKLVVFTPAGDLERVSRALFEAGAGVIGEYRECGFRVAGRGTFFGSAASNPTIGQAGRREEVDEWRLEVLCPQAALSEIVAAMRAAHSYEEPAFDIYPLVSLPSHTGAGRWGTVPVPTSLERFAARVKTALACPLVQVVGARDRSISRVAVACGSGAEFLRDAAAAGCDALVTGEASFHRLLEAEAMGIALVLGGHYATERVGVESLADRLTHEFPELEIWASQAERNPTWQV